MFIAYLIPPALVIFVILADSLRLAVRRPNVPEESSHREVSLDRQALGAQLGSRALARSDQEPRPETRKLSETHDGTGTWSKRLGFDGVFDLIIESSAAEPALDDGHREWTPTSANDRLECLGLALGDYLAGQDLATGILLAQPCGEILGQVAEVEVPMRMSQDQEIIRPDALGRSVGEEKCDLGGREHRASPRADRGRTCTARIHRLDALESRSGAGVGS